MLYQGRYSQAQRNPLKFIANVPTGKYDLPLSLLNHLATNCGHK
jgi:hypothetical protein